jgi:hypothetical protein
MAFIPIAIASGLWYFSKKINWIESLCLALGSALIVLVFHFAAIKSMTDDVETFSGTVTTSQFVPQWVEYYEEAIYRTETYTTTETDSKGNSHTVTHTRQVFSHWESRNRTHYEHWIGYDDVNGSYSITQERYKDILVNFGKQEARPGCRSTSEHKSRMVSGDPNDYYTVNVKNYIYPVTGIRTFENRVKAAPSVFSYEKLPENAPVFEYPKNNDKFVSDRCVGAVGVTTLKLDQMNAVLGPNKKVNVILVGFGDKSINDAQLQEAKWVGGKKNDLVICFGGGTIIKPSWCYVFGWTESDLCKQNIQSIVLKNGMSNDVLPLIQTEIMKTFAKKDWHKFDYLTVEVPFSRYIQLFFILLVLNIGAIIYMMKNEFEK